MSENELIIQLKGVSKSFPNQFGEAQQILSNVDLSLNRGESLAIVGPSGSGKSTLLNIIGALADADEGSVVVDQLNLKELNEKDKINFRQSKVGFIFQKHHLLPQCTLLENVLMPSLATSQVNSQRTTLAKELLNEVGLAERQDYYPTQLSGGECQRGAVVRALVHKPPIVLADEPTGSLDGKRAESLIDLMLNLKLKHDMSLVVVTHSENVAQKMDRVLKLSEGCLV